jgi:hypothetical protein
MEMGLIVDTQQRTGRTKQIIVYRLNMPEKGTVKEYQKRNSTENGTVPIFPGNSPVFSSKQSQKRDTEPLGTVKEPKSESERTARAPEPIPVGVDPDRWQAYRDQLEEDGKLSISRIRTAQMQLAGVIAAGYDPNAVLAAAVMRGLRDLTDTAARLAAEAAERASAATGGTHADRTQGRALSAVERVRAANERADREEQFGDGSGRVAVLDG